MTDPQPKIDATILNPSGTVSLLLAMPDGKRFLREYHIRSAVVWPMRRGVNVIGSFVVGAWDIEKKRLLIVHTRSFVSVDHIIAEHRMIQRGLVEDLQLMWTRYRTTRIYYSGDEAEHDRYRVMVARSAQLEPKPSFVRVTTSLMAVRLWKQMELFRVQAGTELANDLAQWEANAGSDLEPSPLILALSHLIAGIEEYPYRPVAA